MQLQLKLHQLWRNALWISRLQLGVFLYMRIFWLKRVFPSLIIESLAEPTIHSVDPVSEQLTYRIIDDGTIHRKKKLIDSRGFTYNVEERGKETTCWQSTVRPKGNYCRATVKERNGQFVMGKQSHNHPPLPVPLPPPRLEVLALVALFLFRTGTCDAKNSWEFFADAIFCFVKIYFQKRGTNTK